ncbi:MAG: hypothetical protein EHM23_12970 [Acidobacteria bacterium]|nr:MAG: hypothetical protein EHM23_12970 [Acidobacteriota bacterium]
MKRSPLLVILAVSLCVPILAKYKIKEFKPKAATEYAARQDFQNIVIAADPRLTEEGVLELFDTKKLLDRLIMPVVIVVKNNNDFAIRIRAEDILMVDSTGAQIPGMPYDEVLLRVSLKNHLGTYSGRKEILLRQVGDKNMVMDFEHKYFGEKLIAPHDSDYGVVFFAVPSTGDLSGTRLYIPKVHNITKDEPLMFFEFDLDKSTK